MLFNNRRNTSREGGFVIVVALIGLLVLSFFVITSMSSSTTSLKVSGSYAKTVDTFNVAEVGIAKARPIVEAATSYTALLASHQGTPLIAKTNFNRGSYEVWVLNNAGDSNPAVDTDNIIVVRSIGTNADGGRVQIETNVQRATAALTYPPAPPTTGRSPTLFCGVNQKVTVSGSSSQIDGNDYRLNGSAVGGSAGGPALASEAGVIFNGTTYTGAANPSSSNLLVPTGKNKIQAGQGTAAACDSWETIANQLASLSSSAPNVYILNGGTYANKQYGDCNANKPVIVIAQGASNTNCQCEGSGSSGNGGHSGNHCGGGSGLGHAGSASCNSGAGNSGTAQSGTITFTGTSSICGVLVVGSNISVTSTGTFTMKGLTLVYGQHSGLALSTGTSNIYGSVISFSQGAYSSNGSGHSGVTLSDALGVSGNAKIRYSSEAINLSSQVLTNVSNGGAGGGANITVAWKETY